MNISIGTIHRIKWKMYLQFTLYTVWKRLKRCKFNLHHAYTWCWRVANTKQTMNEWMKTNPLELKFLGEKCCNIFTTKSLNPRRKHFKFQHTWHHARLVWQVKMKLLYDSVRHSVFVSSFYQTVCDEFTFIHLFNNSIHSVSRHSHKNRVQFYYLYVKLYIIGIHDKGIDIRHVVYRIFYSL